RASYRGLAPDATELWPDPTYQQKDWKALVPGEWTPVRVAIAGFQHVFRAGSRIRISVDTPGDSRAAWRFAPKTFTDPAHYTAGLADERRYRTTPTTASAMPRMSHKCPMLMCRMLNESSASSALTAVAITA